MLASLTQPRLALCKAQPFIPVEALKTILRVNCLTTRYLRAVSTGLLVMAAVLFTVRPNAAADDTWTGNANTGYWNNAGNWDGGLPSGTYGTLYFNDRHSGSTTLTDDIATLNQNALRWYDASSWTINAANGAVINLFDNGGTQARVENFSTGTVTLNVAITFAATTGAAWAEINAVNGNVTFDNPSAAGTLTVNGSAVNGIRLYGGGHTTTFNNTVSASGRYFATVGTSTASVTMAVGGLFSSGDIYLINGGVLNYNAGTITTTALRLGGDNGATTGQDLTRGATFNLTAAGLNFNNIINTVSGNTSGALVINSQNAVGTNTLAGAIYLDNNLAINQTASGTLVLSNNTIDLKNQTLTVGGAGTVNASGNLVNSTGSGKLNYAGTGTLLLNGNNTYTGATTVSSGTLGGGGTIAGAVNINSGGTITGGTRGDVGALTLASTVSINGTYLADVSGDSSDRLALTGGNALTLGTGSTLTISGDLNGTSTYTLATYGSLSGTFTNVNNLPANYGLDYGATSLSLVPVPEPATWMSGVALLGAACVVRRRCGRKAV